MKLSSYRLDPLYVNQRRVRILTDAESVPLPLEPGASEKERAYALSVAHTRRLARWLQASADIFPFEVDWNENWLAPGRVVTVARTFTFRNARGRRKGIDSCGYTNFAELATDSGEVSLRLLLHPDHVVVGSPGDLLERKVSNLFVVATIYEKGISSVDAVPIFIGYRISQGAMPQILMSRHAEIFPDDIDNFSEIRNIRRPPDAQREVLRTTPEETIKRLLAKVLEESPVPKDWGGERSDLFSTRVQVAGRRISTAFLLKGPAGGAKFRPMVPADLGKNGDQIGRLATEPANLLVLQHCHDVTPPVRDLLRAYSSQVGRERHYCIIDGNDTARLLQAYGHLLVA